MYIDLNISRITCDFSISGLDLFNTQLRDYSISFKEDEKMKLKKDLHCLESFKNQKMSANQKQSYDIMEYYMNISVNTEHSEEFNYHHYLINQMNGAQSEIISFITKFHRILSINDAEAYLIRVECFISCFLILISSFIFYRYKEYQKHLINLLINK
jgi:uncharacterized protein (DUF885 family)